ncbi:MAG: DNA-binding protein [Clostridia bacterium]|nr:DNA-binding protein [Clostridia bacterium]
MDYRKFGDACYIRVDKGEEIIEALLQVCRLEGFASATYSGIGGCASAQLQVFNPQKGAFDTQGIEGMLELVSFTGNVITDGEGRLCHHTHALFAFEQDGEHRVRGGHLKAATVLYTAEIELRAVLGGAIGHRLDPETGTGFWHFD